MKSLMLVVGFALLVACAVAAPVEKRPPTRPHPPAAVLQAAPFLRTVHADVSTGESFDVTVLSVDPRRAEISVILVPERFSPYQRGDSIGMREVADKLFAEPTNDSYRAVAVVSGGLSSSRVDVPLGLLVVDRRTVSRLNEAEAKPTPNCPASLPKDRALRWSGILCQAASNGQWLVARAAEYKPDDCAQAIQSGPTLVETGKNAICVDEATRKTRYDRMVVCVDGAHTLHFVYAKTTNLYPLAEWLASPTSKGGLDCDWALNLSGDTSAGIALQTRKLGGKEIEHVGVGMFPLASAILIRWK